MEGLKVALTEKYNSNLYMLESKAPVSDVSALAEQFGLRFLYLDGTTISTGTEFLDRIAKVLDCFPMAYNWNALLDNMRDLSWLPSDRGYVLLFDNFQTFAQQERYFFDVTIDTLRDAADFWNSEMQNSQFMYILLRGDSSVAAPLTEIPKLS